MGAATAGTFSCESCGKSYRWKPELAGRRAKCKCGAVMLCPATEPGKQEDDLFELAPDVNEAKSPRPVVAATHVATHAVPIATTPSGVPLQYRSPKNAEKASGEPTQLIDLWAPLFLIGGGVAGEILAAFIRTRGDPQGMAGAMFGLSVGIFVGTAFMVVGMWVAAKLRGLSLGSPGTALLKLCAIAIAPGAAIDLLDLPLRIIPLFGWIIAWIIGFILYFALIGTLFELDQEDTWYCVMVIFLVKIATALAFVFGAAFVLHGH